jgi:hypothetical protein
MLWLAPQTILVNRVGLDRVPRCVSLADDHGRNIFWRERSAHFARGGCEGVRAATPGFRDVDLYGCADIGRSC